MSETETWNPWAPRVFRDRTHVIIELWRRGPEYDIPVRELRTPEGREAWRRHLADKVWAKGGVVEDIMDAARTPTWPSWPRP